jgi:hypothetical protein
VTHGLNMKPSLHPPIRGLGASLTHGRNLAPAPALVGSDIRQISTPAGKIDIPISEEQAKVTMGEMHEGMCGTQQSAHKMKWMIRRAGYYWPMMVEYCFKYFRGCEACQRLGDIQNALASMMHPIIKPCPFRGWGWNLLERYIHHH